MQSGRAIVPIEVLAVRGDVAGARADRAAAEEPLEIRAAGPGQEPVSVAVTMRTPGHDEELAVGFLYTEGLVASADELARPATRELAVEGSPANIVTVRVRREFDASALKRNFFATSSCGVCGKATLDMIERASEPLGRGPIVARGVILGLVAKLRGAQAAFETTGGLHATGLFDAAGELLLVREDVGRHNAMDKVIGRALLDRALPFGGHVLLASGRLSFELVQKAAMAGATILCGVSAPSSLAIEAADRLGMTLVGFLRGDGFNVYTRPSRIDLSA